jgi:hypothetical protein
MRAREDRGNPSSPACICTSSSFSSSSMSMSDAVEELRETEGRVRGKNGA